MIRYIFAPMYIIHYGSKIWSFVFTNLFDFFKHICCTHTPNEFVIFNFIDVILSSSDCKVILISAVFHVNKKVVFNTRSGWLQRFTCRNPKVVPELSLTLIRFDHVIPHWNSVFPTALVTCCSLCTLQVLPSTVSYVGEEPSSDPVQIMEMPSETTMRIMTQNFLL